jgi:hypothetical protein
VSVSRIQLQGIVELMSHLYHTQTNPNLITIIVHNLAYTVI